MPPRPCPSTKRPYRVRHEPTTKMESSCRSLRSSAITLLVSSTLSSPLVGRSWRSTVTPPALTTATSVASGSKMHTATSSYPAMSAMPPASASAASISDTETTFCTPRASSASRTARAAASASTVQLTPTACTPFSTTDSLASKSTESRPSASNGASSVMSSAPWSTGAPSPVVPSTSTQRTAVEVTDRPSTRSIAIPLCLSSGSDTTAVLCEWTSGPSKGGHATAIRLIQIVHQS